MKKISIGQFEVISGKVIVSDPCYGLGTWCQAVLEKVKNGIWSAFVFEKNEGRIAELLAVADEVSRENAWEKINADIGVDSGQCGIFDASHYRDTSVVKSVIRIGEGAICSDDDWYSICCDRTLNTEHSAGIIPYGCVSSSGYGDGSYQGFIQKNDNGDICGIKIEFISEEEREE